MITEILLAAGTDPDFRGEASWNPFRVISGVGKSESFCNGGLWIHQQLLSFYPRIGIILNMKTIWTFSGIWTDIVPPSTPFCQLLPEDGLLIISGDISDYGRNHQRTFLFRLSPLARFLLRYYYDGISHDEFAHASFTLHLRGIRYSVKSGRPGV